MCVCVRACVFVNLYIYELDIIYMYMICVINIKTCLVLIDDKICQKQVVPLMMYNLTMTRT